MKRPLLLLLGVWILGECAARLAGIPLVPATPLDARMHGRDTAVVRASGTVRQIRRTTSGFSYVLEDVQAQMPDGSYRTRDVLVFTKDISGVKIGFRLETAGVLSPFETPGNPGQFDLRSYYRALGIDYRLEEESRTVLESRVRWIPQALTDLREALAHSLEELAGREEAGVMEAVLLGDRSQLTLEVKNEYQSASMSHLLSISGLHVSLFGMGICRLLKRLGVPRPVWIAGSGTMAAGYVLLTGSSTSARRAFWMFLLFLGAEAAGRTYDSLSAMSAAALLILWSRPLLLFQGGFQMSFLAVLGVAGIWPVLRGGTDGRDGRDGPGRGLGFSLAVQWAVWPAAAAMNGVIPLCGLWVNLLVLPLSGLLLGFSGAAAALGLVSRPAARWAVLPARSIVRWFGTLSAWSGRLPGQQLVTGCPEGWQTALYYGLLSAAVFFLYRGKKRREKQGQDRRQDRRTGRRFPEIRKICAAVLFSALLLLVLHRLPPDGVQITCIDVGQGNSVLIRSGDICCLVDAGSSQVKEIGENRILPYLHSQGIAALDALILTHADADHINGTAALLSAPAMHVGMLCLTEAEETDPALSGIRRLAEQTGTPLRRLSAGDSWSAGGVFLSCIYPRAEDCERFSEDGNNTSLVLYLEAEGCSALLPGDLGTEGEDVLASRGQIPRAQVLLTGHHGSRYSSGETFLEAVRPKIGLISCGRNNRYGHPHPDTINRLEAVGCQPVSTAECGAVTVLLRNGSISLYRYRKEDE